MRTFSVAAVVVTAVLQTACLQFATTPVLERRTEQGFNVEPGSIVRIAVSGGPITVTTGRNGRVEATLVEQVYASSEDEAKEVLETVDTLLAQEDEEVTIRGRRSRNGVMNLWGPTRVQFSAIVTVPPNVRLDARTSGGRVQVSGDRDADTTVDTSGGSISVDGGAGRVNVETSGGGIRIGKALGELRAHTSGGSVSLDYVGPDASDVDVSTSGGSITVGIDPRASVALDASTSGGSVHVDGLPFSFQSKARDRARGTINGGRGRVVAHTSGGSVRIRDAVRR